MFWIERLNLRGVVIESFEISTNKNMHWLGDYDLIYDLFQILSGLQDNYEGSILWNDKDIRQLNAVENRSMRRELGFVFDWGGLISNQTLLQNILLPLQYYNEFHEDMIHEIEGIYKRAGYEKELYDRPFHVAHPVRKFTSLIRGIFSGVKCLMVEDIAMGLRPKDIELIHDLLETKNLNVHYYDSLGKFSLENSDSMSIISNQEESVA
tara:strand:+ start:2327 stop:2953 length:627 start_codon:yes stop_codon:yes gene_type:complete